MLALLHLRFSVNTLYFQTLAPIPHLCLYGAWWCSCPFIPQRQGHVLFLTAPLLLNPPPILGSTTFCSGKSSGSIPCSVNPLQGFQTCPAPASPRLTCLQLPRCFLIHREVPFALVPCWAWEGRPGATKGPGEGAGALGGTKRTISYVEAGSGA